jgi:putative tricarboxylic transport membrane protein
MLYRLDVVFLSVFMGMSGAAIWLTRSFPDTGERFGPAFLPRVLGVLLVGFSAALFLRWISAARGGRLARAEIPVGFGPKAALLGLALVAYLTLLGQQTPLGFPGLTALFLFGTGLLFGGRSPVHMGLMAVATTIGLYLFFRIWLHVPLAPSAWF